MPSSPTTPRRFRPRLALVLAGLLVLGVALAVVLATGGGSSARVVPTKDARYLNADTPGVRTFENGDCFHDLAVNEAMGEPILNTVGCVGAENQVYGFAALDEGPWNQDLLAAQADARCRQLATQVWSASQLRALRFYPAMPSERSWRDERDRDAMCVVASPDGPFRADPIETGRAS